MSTIAHEEELIGAESHVVPKIDPDSDCNGKKTVTIKFDDFRESMKYVDQDLLAAIKEKHDLEALKGKQENRTYFKGYCNAPAGRGTDHTGEGRCKHHGGNVTPGPGAPAHNQNAAKSYAHSDPHHYAESLDPEEEEFVEDTTAAILDRIRREHNKEPDFLDRTLARMVAVELHMFWSASEYTKGELIQVIVKDGSSIEQPGPLVEEVRRFSNSIFQNLDRLGVLPKPQQEQASQLDKWLDIVEKQDGS